MPVLSAPRMSIRGINKNGILLVDPCETATTAGTDMTTLGIRDYSWKSLLAVSDDRLWNFLKRQNILEFYIERNIMLNCWHMYREAQYNSSYATSLRRNNFFRENNTDLLERFVLRDNYIFERIPCSISSNDNYMLPTIRWNVSQLDEESTLQPYYIGRDEDDIVTVRTNAELEYYIPLDVVLTSEKRRYFMYYDFMRETHDIDIMMSLRVKRNMLYDEIIIRLTVDDFNFPKGVEQRFVRFVTLTERYQIFWTCDQYIYMFLEKFIYYGIDLERLIITDDYLYLATYDENRKKHFSICRNSANTVTAFNPVTFFDESVEAGI